MTIGELLRNLRMAKPDVSVRYDFCGMFPTTVDSSRGDYARPALGWACPDDLDNYPTVADLIVELEKAVDGRLYHGYKGGEYVYTTGSQLCVDNWGQWTSTELRYVSVDDYEVILHTIRAED